MYREKGCQSPFSLQNVVTDVEICHTVGAECCGAGLPRTIMSGAKMTLFPRGEDVRKGVLSLDLV